MSPPLLFHINLFCASCGNKTVVNLEGFTAKRAMDLDAGIDGHRCGICQQPKLRGRVHPGASAEARTMVRDGPTTWSREALAAMLERPKAGAK